MTFSLGFLAAAACVAGAFAAPRDATPRATPRSSGPSATVPQTEPMDLDEGKSGQQMFTTACVVCHQSPQGLAKGRGASALGSFLRQHYTTGSNQAGRLADFLTTGGLDRGTPTPVRAIPGDKPDDKPVKPEPAAISRKPKPEETRPRPEPDAAAAQRRLRNEDGSTQPVEGLVVLPPNADQLPDNDGKPRRETRPGEPAPAATPGRQRQPRPSDIKPAEHAKPVEAAKPVEIAKPAEEPAPAAPAVQAEAPRPPRDPAAAHSPLTEDRPKAAPADVQEIPL